MTGAKLPIENAEGHVRLSMTESDAAQRVERLEEQLRALQEQLRQAQRTQTVGVLAAGIAHDFNNLLAAILALTEMIQAELGPGHSLQSSIDVIATAASQGVRLTGQILRLVRDGKSEIATFDLQGVLRQVAGLVSRISSRRIRIQWSFGMPEFAVKGDPAQLYQVFLNLALNARDAMPEGGELTFSTRVASPSPAQAGQTFGCVSVIDTGSGIPDEIRSKIFDQFFTTKSASGGFGMGLAVVDRVIAEHSGAIEVESGPNRGSKFHIYLPLATDAEPAAPAKQDKIVVHGSGVILIVEDDFTSRICLAALLRRLGYQVVSAGDGETALEFLRLGGKPDLMVVALGPGGPVLDKLLAEVRRHGVAAPCVAISESDESAPDGVVGILTRPFDLGALSKSIADSMV